MREFNEGYDAHSHGKSMIDCPYDKDPQKNDWEVGWLSAESDDLQAEYYNYDPRQEML